MIRIWHKQKIPLQKPRWEKYSKGQLTCRRISIKCEPPHIKSSSSIGEDKATDQLCSNCTADQHLYFRYSYSTTPFHLKSGISNFSQLLWSGNYILIAAFPDHCLPFTFLCWYFKGYLCIKLGFSLIDKCVTFKDKMPSTL